MCVCVCVCMYVYVCVYVCVCVDLDLAFLSKALLFHFSLLFFLRVSKGPGYSDRLLSRKILYSARLFDTFLLSPSIELGMLSLSEVKFLRVLSSRAPVIDRRQGLIALLLLVITVGRRALGPTNYQSPVQEGLKPSQNFTSDKDEIPVRKKKTARKVSNSLAE